MALLLRSHDHRLSPPSSTAFITAALLQTSRRSRRCGAFWTSTSPSCTRSPSSRCVSNVKNQPQVSYTSTGKFTDKTCLMPERRPDDLRHLLPALRPVRDPHSNGLHSPEKMALIMMMMMINVYLTHAGHSHMVLNHRPHSHVVTHDRPKAASHPPWHING